MSLNSGWVHARVESKIPITLPVVNRLIERAKKDLREEFLAKHDRTPLDTVVRLRSLETDISGIDGRVLEAEEKVYECRSDLIKTVSDLMSKTLSDVRDMLSNHPAMDIGFVHTLSTLTDKVNNLESKLALVADSLPLDRIDDLLAKISKIETSESGNYRRVVKAMTRRPRKKTQSSSSTTPATPHWR